MRREHFDALRPLCPTCRLAGSAIPLHLAEVLVEHGTHVVEGRILCGATPAAHEFPIIDGIPFILAGLSEFLPTVLYELVERRDLTDTTWSILRDACGVSSPINVSRARRSSYTWSHWGDFDPEAPTPSPEGSLVGLVHTGLELLPSPLPSGPLLDLGCAAGRATHELAATHPDRLILGIDLNVPLLRQATEILRTGRVRYPLHCSGVIYDERDFPVDPPGSDRVDFWACDVHALPFEDESVAMCASLNVLDSVHDPVAHLQELGRVLAPDGAALVSSPFHWKEGGPPQHGWIGGYAQRALLGGVSSVMLRDLLTADGGLITGPGTEHRLRLHRELDGVPWRVRLDARATTHFDTYLASARKSSAPEDASTDQ